MAILSGTPSRFQATAASHQPYPFGISQRYTVALLSDCHFASAIPIWPISAVHRRILHDSCIMSAVLHRQLLAEPHNTTTLPPPYQPDFQGYTSRTPRAPKWPPLLGSFHPATTAIQYWKTDVIVWYPISASLAEYLQASWLIRLYGTLRISVIINYIFVICVILWMTTYNYHSIPTGLWKHSISLYRSSVRGTWRSPLLGPWRKCKGRLWRWASLSIVAQWGTWKGDRIPGTLKDE